MQADAISSDIVGYTADSVGATLQNHGVCFMNTDGTDVDLQTIVPKNGTADAVDGSFRMRWFNDGHYDYAVWSVPLYNPEDPEEELDYNGWGDVDEMCPVTKTFAPGQWFLIQSTAASPNLTVSGKLVSSDTTKPQYSVSLVSGALQATGNPFPTSCDIQSIIPQSNGADAADGQFRMRWFNDGHYDYAVWSVPLYNPEDPEEELDYNGWGDVDEMCPITKTFNPGEGFLIQTTATKGTLLFPNALYTPAE